MSSVAPVDRVLAKIAVHPLGCWEFTGTLNEAGYGIVNVGRIGTVAKAVRKAHRIVYEDFLGSIPEGLTLDHLCFNPRCVNPAHLEVVTNGENVRRAWRAGRMDPGASLRARTHCVNGHPWDEANTRYRKNTQSTVRVCRACTADAKARHKARQA